MVAKKKATKKAPVKKAPTSGAGRLKASGKRGILFGVTADEYALIQGAAEQDERKMAAWVRKTCLDAAKRSSSRSSSDAVAEQMPSEKKGKGA